MHNVTHNKLHTSLSFIPLMLLVLVVVSIVGIYKRSYVTGAIHYFITEESVENFNPFEFSHGDN